jgi:alginate O-acetyltransferase complex protein AlgI
VYIPLGGNRKGLPRTILNMLAVWLLTGLWHGASWNFILWGLYYFVFLLIEKLLGKERVQKIPGAIRHAAVLLIVLAGWIIFRVEDVGRIGEAFAGLFRFDGGSAPFLLEHHDALYPLYLLLPACVGCTPVAGWVKKKLPEEGAFWLSVVFDVLLFALCVALLLGASYNPFIYFRF